MQDYSIPQRAGSVSVRSLLIILCSVALCLIILAAILGAYLERLFDRVAKDYDRCAIELRNDGVDMITNTSEDT